MWQNPYLEILQVAYLALASFRKIVEELLWFSVIACVALIDTAARKCRVRGREGGMGGTSSFQQLGVEKASMRLLLARGVRVFSLPIVDCETALIKMRN